MQNPAYQLLSFLFSQMGGIQTLTALLTSAGILLRSCWPVGTVPVEAIWAFSRAVCHSLALYLSSQKYLQGPIFRHFCNFPMTLIGHDAGKSACAPPSINTILVRPRPLVEVSSSRKLVHLGTGRQSRPQCLLTGRIWDSM